MSVSHASVQPLELDGSRAARKRERHAERRRQILNSARTLLVRGGIENFTIAQVAAEASVSKPAVYYYFDSKEDLVCHLSLDVLAAERERLEFVLAGGGNAVDALSALIRARIDFFVQDPDSFRILHVWGPMLGLQPRLEASSQFVALMALVEGVAQRLAAERDRLRPATRVDAEKVPELAWAMSQGIIAAAALGPAHATDVSRVEELRDRACRWLLDSLVA
jgi:AcrR family transcriptional regulator